MIYIVTLQVEVPDELENAKQKIHSDIVKNISEELMQILNIDVESTGEYASN